MPGLDGTGELFRGLIDTCPSTFRPRVLTYPRDRSLTTAELVARSTEMLGSEGKSLLIAESFSGPVAVRVARESGDRLLGIVLCNSFIRSPIPAILRTVPLSMVFAAPPPRWAVRRYLVGAGAPDDLVAQVRRTIRSVPPRVIAGRVRTVLRTDVRRELRECPVPVLYIRGTEDRLVGERSVREILEANPGVLVERIPGPHFLLQVAPAQAWGSVERFVHTVL